MFAGETTFIRSELEALKAQPDGGTKWKPAIEDSGVGQASRMAYEPETNANMVHQAFHLMMWNKATLKELSDLETIVEFGGGYGATALIASRLGFKGAYFLVDLPEMSLLQQYYLAQHKLNCEVHFLTSQPALFGADLYIAVYSLTETDIPTRWAQLDLTAKSYLFAMNETWDDIDNMEWFRQVEITIPLRWSFFPMVRPGHWYAIGGLTR